MLRNLSSGVISDVLFEFRRRGETTLIGAVGADVLAAGEGWERRFTFDPPLALPAELSPPDLFDMVVTFTDARGLRWIRRGRAQPERIVDTRTDPTLLPRFPTTSRRDFP